MSTNMPKIALGDQVFGNHLFEEEFKPVFDRAMECNHEIFNGRKVVLLELFRKESFDWKRCIHSGGHFEGGAG